jgi:hypothetical protein
MVKPVNFTSKAKFIRLQTHDKGYIYILVNENVGCHRQQAEKGKEQGTHQLS